MSIIIDIFNNLLKYNKQDIFIVVDKYNQIWFIIRKIKDFSYEVGVKLKIFNFLILPVQIKRYSKIIKLY